MDTLIRFKLQYNEDEININPIYKDDISIEWSKETNQEFFRPKLSGKIQFVKEDFEIIDNAPFETKFIVIVEQSKDYAQTWEEIYKGYFYKTDCSFDLDNKIISVLPNTLDQYTDVLNGLENEYNLIELAPVINPLVINKRPLIQIYKAGDSVLSRFQIGRAHV